MNVAVAGRWVGGLAERSGAALRLWRCSALLSERGSTSSNACSPQTLRQQKKVVDKAAFSSSIANTC